jgi:predicted Zn-dependent protease
MTTPPPTLDDGYDAFRRAEAYLRQGHPADAARLVDPVVAAFPDDTAALELQARALFASAQLLRAEQALRALVQRRPDDAWARTALARTLERQSRPDEAQAQRALAQALGGAERRLPR